MSIQKRVLILILRCFTNWRFEGFFYVHTIFQGMFRRMVLHLNVESIHLEFIDTLHKLLPMSLVQ